MHEDLIFYDGKQAKALIERCSQEISLHESQTYADNSIN
jgi:hypothetical protein